MGCSVYIFFSFLQLGMRHFYVDMKYKLTVTLINNKILKGLSANCLQSAILRNL